MRKLGQIGLKGDHKNGRLLCGKEAETGEKV